MILDTLFIESLSNFVHGLSTAFFPLIPQHYYKIFFLST